MALLFGITQLKIMSLTDKKYQYIYLFYYFVLYL